MRASPETKVIAHINILQISIDAQTWYPNLNPNFEEFLQKLIVYAQKLQRPSKEVKEFLRQFQATEQENKST